MKNIKLLSMIEEIVAEKYPQWLSNLEKYFLPAYAWRCDLLTRWRERILFTICFITSVFGPIALIPSLILAYTEKRWDVIILDSFSYSVSVTILLARSVPLIVRAWSICLTLYVLGVGLLFMLGSLGAGYIWLFGASVMAGTLIGLRASFFALMMNLLALITVGVFISFWHPDWPATPSNALEKWLIMVLNFMLLNTIVTLTIAVMLNGLQRALSKEQELSNILRQSEERFRAAFHTSPDAISITRFSDGLCVDVNDGFTKIMGYSRDEVIGYPLRHLDPGDDSEYSWQLVQELIAGGNANNMEIRFRTKDDQVKSGLLSTSELDDNGILHILSVIRDITVFKETEKQLQYAQKIESIGSLAGGIAHDLNNILFPISGLSEMLLDEIPPENPAHESIEQIHKSAKRGSDLVKQILAFSRQSNPRKLPIRIQPILNEVLKLARATIPRSIEITSLINSDCGLISADPTQVHQIVMNLITNAFHAVESTGGTIHVELKEAVFEKKGLYDNSMPPDGTSESSIRLLAGNYACITISDTGTGIDQALIHKIFEPYFTTKAQGKGTGLGLSVVHGIVKEYGGDIRVYSGDGKETTFSVYLPLLEDMKNRTDAAITTKYPTGCESILLVDDEEPVVRMEQMILERLGYQVTTRTSSPDALAAFKANPSKFDLVISDRGMPNMTGDRLASKLMAIRPEIPIILCTGFGNESDKLHAKSKGVKGFLMKPVAKGDLAVMVRKALDEAGNSRSEARHAQIKL
jgi:two-component system, cell cycle sensor histidine kinase and response regulator CckA